jgi:SAM-dependent methyltransferase
VPDERTADFYDANARSWSDSHADPEFWSDARQRFTARLGHGDVLEIGSGGGIAAEWLTRSGYQYAGTDVSEGLIRVARERVPGAQFFRQEPAGLDFPGRVFDGLCSASGQSCGTTRSGLSP